ncbi:MAG TPA: CNNM domain-containing protein [Gammaproteobacteria bacterium]|nr:CNNM domain-containing protein [Gammaproteobacteria bacterium]
MSQFELISYSAILVLLILLAAFFACAETGLMVVNRYRLRHKARLKKRYAIRILQLLKRPDRLLGAILIGNTFTTILASSLATMIALHFWGDNGAFLVAILLTLVILIFAEITPKTLAAIYPDQVSRFVVYPIQFFLRWLYPVVWFANAIANRFLRLLRIKVGNYSIESLSREELRSVVYDATDKISRQYQHMLLSILDLNRLTVDDVMIPLHDIQGINIEQAHNHIIEQVKQSVQDWIPVYRGHINQVIGVLYLRDVMRLLLLNDTLAIESLQKQLKEPYFIPEGTLLHIQLTYFQQHPDKIAFVVDEYGEIQGLITLNDILEEIVGDFTTSIAIGKQIKKQIDGSYLVDGKITIREFNRVAGWDLPLRRPKTINGLITEHLETLPHTGTSMLIAGYPIEIIIVKENRVKQARIFPRLPDAQC